MSENVFDKALILDEEWSKVQISRLSSRPNAKTAYGSGGYDANAMKAAFDAQGNMLKEHHNSLVDSLSEIGRSEAKRQQAENKRQESYKNAELERNELYNAAEKKRNEEFAAKEAERVAKFDKFDLVQTPGNSTTKAMSQKAVTDYVPKVKTRNLMTLVFENAMRRSDDGTFVRVTSDWSAYGKNYAASPDYIAVESGKTYTFSWEQRDTKSYMYVQMYDKDKVFIKNVATHTNTRVSLVVETPENCCYVSVNFYGDETPWRDLLLNKFQMELGDTPSPYILPEVISGVALPDYAQGLGNSTDKGISQQAFTTEVSKTNGKVEGMLDNFVPTAKIAYTTGECNIATNTQALTSIVGYAIPIKKSNFPIKCTGVSTWITSNFTELDIVVELLNADLKLIKKLAEEKIELTAGHIGKLYAKYYTATCDFYREQIETEVAYIRIYIPNTTADYEGKINLGTLLTPQTSDEIDVSLYPCYYEVVGRGYLSKDLTASGTHREQRRLIQLETQAYNLPLRQTSYEAYGLPVLEFEGDISAMNKDNAVTLAYKYGDHSGSCTLKWQGSSSIAYPKKNYTVKFDNAFEAKEGWGEQKKYCLKANYIDFSHSRNICCAKLWGGVVKSRNGVDKRLTALVNGGAIDGFPTCVVINGEYQGVYTFNIPKDGWMFGMGNESSTDKMAILCADAGDDAGAKVCSFKALATVTEADFEIEYATDEDNTEWINTSLNRLIQACIDSDGTDLDTTIAQYLDWQSAIDYYAMCLVLRNFDGLTKNYLLVTYDGTKWFFSAYDMDSTFGMWFNGTKFTRVDGYDVSALASSHRVFELIKTYKADELKARYNELVNGALSEETVIETFTNFAGQIPKALLDEEVKIWTTLPSTSVNNVFQIIDFNRRRRAYIDPQIEKL